MVYHRAFLTGQRKDLSNFSKNIPRQVFVGKNPSRKILGYYQFVRKSYNILPYEFRQHWILSRIGKCFPIARAFFAIMPRYFINSPTSTFWSSSVWIFKRSLFVSWISESIVYKSCTSSKPCPLNIITI